MKKIEKYFVKSLEKDFATKTVKAQKKVVCQTIDTIVKGKKIIPNTVSFGHKKRLACTLLHTNYTKTYRSQGIIFQTKDTPDYIAPFDLSAVIATDDITVQYYRIEHKLHEYYNHKIISGHEKFIFKNADSMFKVFPSPKIAWKEVNKFRVEANLKPLKNSKYKLVEYNEVIFHKNVRITPIAIYGYTPLSRKVAKKYNLPHFRSAKLFFESLHKNAKKLVTV